MKCKAVAGFKAILSPSLAEGEAHAVILLLQASIDVGPRLVQHAVLHARRREEKSGTHSAVPATTKSRASPEQGEGEGVGAGVVATALEEVVWPDASAAGSTQLA